MLEDFAFVEFLPTAWTYVGFAVRYADADSFYWTVLRQTTDSNDQPNSPLKLELAKQYYRLVTINLDFVGQINTLYKLKAEVRGSSFKIYVNDVLIIEREDSTFLNSGRILMWAGRCKARFDDVLVVNHVENVVPEPAPIVAGLIFILAFAVYVKISNRKMPKIRI